MAHRPEVVRRLAEPRPLVRFWKYRWSLKGGHIHAAVFVANHPAQTYSNCGELVMDQDDWNDFHSKLAQYTTVNFEEE